jgi:hypothetical protein
MEGTSTDPCSTLGTVRPSSVLGTSESTNLENCRNIPTLVMTKHVKIAIPVEFVRLSSLEGWIHPDTTICALALSPCFDVERVVFFVKSLFSHSSVYFCPSLQTKPLTRQLRPIFFLTVSHEYLPEVLGVIAFRSNYRKTINYHECGCESTL